MIECPALVRQGLECGGGRDEERARHLVSN